MSASCAAGWLVRVRPYRRGVPGAKALAWQCVALFLLGALLGFLDKYFDIIAPAGLAGRLTQWVQALSTRISPWLFLAACIAAWSQSPRAAAWRVSALFAGMLLLYYAYAAWIYGAFSGYLFLRWGCIALFSPLAACIAWLGRGRGWIAAVCAALIAAIPLATGFPLAAGFGVPHAFDLAIAAFLLGALPFDWRQRVMTAPIAVGFALVLRATQLLSWIFVSGM